jgi:hypothetical protein
MFMILSALCLIPAGIYFYSGASLSYGVPIQDAGFYFMQLSFSQAQIWLLAAILVALWGILAER